MRLAFPIHDFSFQKQLVRKKEDVNITLWKHPKGEKQSTCVGILNVRSKPLNIRM